MPKKLICKYCNKKYGCNIIKNHYTNCLINIFSGYSGFLVKFSAKCMLNYEYYIYALIGSKCKFSQIDKFLKEIWCKCCGTEHSSYFMFNDDDENIPQYEINKNKQINKFKENDKFLYSYDTINDGLFIDITIIKKLKGSENNNTLEILIRNEPPSIKCKRCNNYATSLTNGITSFPICDNCNVLYYINNNNKLEVIDESDIINNDNNNILYLNNETNLENEINLEEESDEEDKENFDEENFDEENDEIEDDNIDMYYRFGKIRFTNSPNLGICESMFN